MKTICLCLFVTKGILMIPWMNSKNRPRHLGEGRPDIAASFSVQQKNFISPLFKIISTFDSFITPTSAAIFLNENSNGISL